MKNTQTRNHLSPLLNHLLVNALFEFETTQTQCKEFLFHIKEGTLVKIND